MRFTFVVAGLFMLPAFAGGCAAAWRKNFKNGDWGYGRPPRAVPEKSTGDQFRALHIGPMGTELISF